MCGLGFFKVMTICYHIARSIESFAYFLVILLDDGGLWVCVGAVRHGGGLLHRTFLSSSENKLQPKLHILLPYAPARAGMSHFPILSVPSAISPLIFPISEELNSYFAFCFIQCGIIIQINKTKQNLSSLKQR